MAASASASATASNAVPLLSRMFGWKPLVATCAAVGTSMVTGDLICQHIEGRTFHSSLLPWHDSPRPSNALDLDRARAMFLTGFTVSGPYSHVMMMGLEHYFPGYALRSAVLPKLAINIATAPIGIALAFTSVALYKNQSMQQAQDRIQNDLLSTYARGAMYWPFVSFMNLRFVPVHYRPAVGGVAGAIWNVYISSVANQQSPSSLPLATSASSSPSSSTSTPTSTSTSTSTATCPSCSKSLHSSSSPSANSSLSISCSCRSLSSPSLAKAAVSLGAS